MPERKGGIGPNTDGPGPPSHVCPSPSFPVMQDDSWQQNRAAFLISARLYPETSPRGRGGRLELVSDTRPPEFTICHVKLQTCQSQDFLQFYFQGQMLRRGGIPQQGSVVPIPATLPRKTSEEDGHIIVSLFFFFLGRSTF